jgi:hypothetical protein
LRAANEILSTKIIWERVEGIVKLSLKNYIKKVRNMFNINNSKLVSTPLESHLRLTKD